MVVVTCLTQLQKYAVGYRLGFEREVIGFGNVINSYTLKTDYPISKFFEGKFSLESAFAHTP